MKDIKEQIIAQHKEGIRAKKIDDSVHEIICQLRGNLATIRGFLHFLEIGQYKATQTELKELHNKLDTHLETSQIQLIKKLELLTDICRSEN